jgi:hypothetical protein
MKNTKLADKAIKNDLGRLPSKAIKGDLGRLPSKNLLFAELIVVILFFSLAAAACVTLFGQARSDSDEARNLTNAVILAQNAAEIFKAGGENTDMYVHCVENSLMVIPVTAGRETYRYAHITVYRVSGTSPIYFTSVSHEMLEEAEIVYELTAVRAFGGAA